MAHDDNVNDDGTDKNPKLQLSREIIIYLIINKLCSCGNESCPSIYKGYHVYASSRRCKNWPEKLYCMINENGITFCYSNNEKYEIVWEDLDFRNPNFDLVLIKDIKDKFKLPE